MAVFLAIFPEGKKHNNKKTHPQKTAPAFCCLELLLLFSSFLFWHSTDDAVFWLEACFAHGWLLWMRFSGLLCPNNCCCTFPIRFAIEFFIEFIIITIIMAFLLLFVTTTTNGGNNYNNTIQNDTTSKYLLLLLSLLLLIIVENLFWL